MPSHEELERRNNSKIVSINFMHLFFTFDKCPENESVQKN